MARFQSKTAQAVTFVEMVLVLLEDRFPWLGTNEPISGADIVDHLNELHRMLKKARTAAKQRKH